MATDCCVVWLRGRSAVAVGRGVACRWVRRCGVAWRGLGVALRMPCGAMWCGVVFRGGGVLELVIGFSGFYLQLYRDSNSSPLRFEANAMLLYNAHPVWIRTKG